MGDIEQHVTITFEQAALGTTLTVQFTADEELETIQVRIPAGVKHGSRVRIQRRGQRVRGERGDLYIIISVHPHPYFRRDGLNVYLDLPISMYEAVLGTTVQVPTLHGKVDLTVPPGTGWAAMRIAGGGIERGGRKGDQFVEIRVVVPKELGAAGRDALETLSKEHPINARADVAW